MKKVFIAILVLLLSSCSMYMYKCNIKKYDNGNIIFDKTFYSFDAPRQTGNISFWIDDTLFVLDNFTMKCTIEKIGRDTTKHRKGELEELE